MINRSKKSPCFCFFLLNFVSVVVSGRLLAAQTPFPLIRWMDWMPVGGRAMGEPWCFRPASSECYELVRRSSWCHHFAKLSGKSEVIIGEKKQRSLQMHWFLLHIKLQKFEYLHTFRMNIQHCSILSKEVYCMPSLIFNYYSIHFISVEDVKSVTLPNQDTADHSEMPVLTVNDRQPLVSQVLMS